MSDAAIKVAVIGAGYWGRNYVRTFSALQGAQLGWVCDLDGEARQRAERTAPHAHITADYQQVLRDPEVQAVVVATRTSHHYEHSMAALRAGKHVLVEKPMTTRVDQAKELVELAAAQSRTLMVGHLMLYHPAVERLSQLIGQGELGRVYYMYALRVNLGRIRSDENALWNFAPHDLSIISFLLGTQPSSVSARGRAYLQPGVEDVVFVNLDFPDRSMAQIQLSWLDPHKERRLTVVGSKKMVVFDDGHASEKLRIYDKGFDRPPEYDSYGDYLSLRNGDVHIPRIGLGEPLVSQCQHFLDCIRGGKTPRSSGQDGLEVIRVLEAADRSIQQDGAPVTIT